MTVKVMCITVDCPVKEFCMRFKARATEHQIFSRFTYNKKTGCERFKERVENG